MARAHAAGSWVVLFAIACFLVTAVAVSRSKVAPYWLDRARNVLVGLIGVQVALGVIAYATGSRPGEPLHLLYGVAALAALPLAQRFAQDAPPSARAGTLAVAAAVMLALVGRAFGTG